LSVPADLFKLAPVKYEKISNYHFEFHAAGRKGESFKHSLSDIEKQYITIASFENIVLVVPHHFVDYLKSLLGKLMIVET
jgi:hypothetical protein